MVKTAALFGDISYNFIQMSVNAKWNTIVDSFSAHKYSTIAIEA